MKRLVVALLLTVAVACQRTPGSYVEDEIIVLTNGEQVRCYDAYPDNNGWECWTPGVKDLWFPNHSVQEVHQ